jgi:hypothetical protein
MQGWELMYSPQSPPNTPSAHLNRRPISFLMASMIPVWLDRYTLLWFTVTKTGKWFYGSTRYLMQIIIFTSHDLDKKYFYIHIVGEIKITVKYQSDFILVQRVLLQRHARQLKIRRSAPCLSKDMRWKLAAPFILFYKCWLVCYLHSNNQCFSLSRLPTWIISPMST